MSKVIQLKIIQEIKNSGPKGMEKKHVFNIAKTKRDLIKRILLDLERSNKIYFDAGRFYDGNVLEKGTISEIKKGFGFASLNDEKNTRVFIPGKFLLGSLVGDVVSIAPIKSQSQSGSSQEGKVVRILQEGKSEILGTVHENKNGLFLSSDVSKSDIPIKHLPDDIKVNDTVLCKVVNRKFSHDNLNIKIIKGYSCINTAHDSCELILDTNDIPRVFPQEVIDCANEIDAKGITPEEISYRKDLRNELIFTIDGASTKDIDDAVSLNKMGEYYELSVHIADVSHYVKKHSPINAEAFTRGTSIYYANQVIPMLPAALSNGICSLNPNVDRLAFTCNMVIDKKGQLIDFSFEKTIIHSKLKGVYHEINQIFDGTASSEINEKYSFAKDKLLLMRELANILTKNKIERGVADIHSNECNVVLDDNLNPVNLLPRSSGEAEVMIEEFMLMANQATATATKIKNIPCIYRVHEPPNSEKVENLQKILKSLNIPNQQFNKEFSTKALADLIEQAKDKYYYPIINTTVLRSMSKAKYFEEPIGHYGLVLENYAQFTSPIRRYPDLVIHRVLSEFISGVHPDALQKKYAKTVRTSASNSTKTEIAALKVERLCEACYKAQYMSQFLGEDFEGVICSVVDYGFYVELPNTVDGLVRIADIPQNNGCLIFDGMFSFKNELTKQEYKIGDKITVTVVKVDILKGNVDFTISTNEKNND